MAGTSNSQVIIKSKPELKTDLDDEQDVKINNSEKNAEELEKKKDINIDPDLVIYDEKERRPSVFHHLILS
jgi:hypothetical protein